MGRAAYLQTGVIPADMTPHPRSRLYRRGFGGEEGFFKRSVYPKWYRRMKLSIYVDCRGIGACHRSLRRRNQRGDFGGWGGHDMDSFIAASFCRFFSSFAA